MSSLSNIEEHLQEQKKRQVENSEEKPEKAKPNEVNLPITMEVDKNKESKTSTTMADLHPFAGRHRKLPPELNCQIFYCLNVAIRRKFICGLGWNFYAMSRQSILIKSKRICNPEENGWIWIRSKEDVTISEDGLNANINTNELRNVYAKKGFPITVATCRMDGFPGTICYYYEVKTLSDKCVIGLSHGETVFGLGCVDVDEFNSGSYTITTISTNGRTGNNQFSELPIRDRPEPPNVKGNVYGCGILMDPDNNFTMFFTFNGHLLEKQIPMSPSVDRFVPLVSIWGNVSTLEANFGNDKDKPFQYDIKNCPGMELDCI